MRLIVKKTMREAGYSGHDFIEAEDGAKGYDMIKTESPDLILCDWNMPVMTGPELLQKLTDEGINITFGFVTTEATPEMKTKATELGAKFLIAKPITPESFNTALDPIIG